MCGIIGFNWKDKVLIKNALKKMGHRGPDDSGIFSDKNASLGHNRLSIIDLSSSGKQPMSNEDKTIWITFNGEIYNFNELKKGLKKKHKFHSNTDTEVLIHLYEEEGRNMLDKLIGMFAFCIYDTKKQLFFIARDRVGIKPLYYYKKRGDFIFASEIKAMLETKKIRRKLNEDALPLYLTFRANVSSETFVKGINKLMPGHYLVYDLKNNTADIKKYWEIKFCPKKRSKKDYLEELKYLLNDAVKIRLMSDVPYGAYLSGGIDSGTIVSLMSKYSPKPIKTFSVGFKEDANSELKEARFLAEKLGTDHHELLIDRSSITELPKIVYQCDEPIADPTIIPIYFLARYNKKYSTVILTGEGADELFAGYPQYRFMNLHNSIIRKLPFFIRNIIILVARKSPRKILDIGFSYASALGEKALERLSNFIKTNNYAEQYLGQIAIFSEEEQKELLKNSGSIYREYSSFFPDKYSRDIAGYCQQIDFKTSLVEDLLMKIDKQTMAFSVEGRVPFLDHRIAELAANIPSKMKLKGFYKDKQILREAVKGLIPKETMKRKKHHFFVPIDSWLDGELASLIDKFLSEEYIKKQNIFNYSYIEKIRRGFKSSKLYYARQLWTLIVFQIWYKQFIENEDVKI